MTDLLRTMEGGHGAERLRRSGSGTRPLESAIGRMIDDLPSSHAYR